MNKNIVILNNPHCCSCHYINTDMSNIDNIFFVKNDVEIVKLSHKTFQNVVLKIKKNSVKMLLLKLCYRTTHSYLSKPSIAKEAARIE